MLAKKKKNLAVVGCQWGDEGKGKIVDWLSLHADVVVRFQGGHNAGHTLVIDDQTFKLSLLPSGIVRPDKMAVIGNGVVIDPWALLKEITELRNHGVEITPSRLRIAENAALILPHHRQLDNLREDHKKQIGTTRRGIGPAYEDKAGRRALRFGDLAYPAYCHKVYRELLEHHSKTLPIGEKEITQQCDSLMELAPLLLPYCAPVWRELFELNRQGKRILYEGAQGMALDLDHGTYPYVTSCNIAQMHTGSGLSTDTLILGLVKAYATRVGSGPFPSEQSNTIGEKLGSIGQEFGTVTARKRRCGWFDAAMVRQAVRIAGVEGIVLTKLDVLDTFSTINIATDYMIHGQSYDYLPANPEAQKAAIPIYETLPGWQSSTRGCRRWEDLPSKALEYIKRIETLIGVPVTLISTSPERNDTILRQPLEKILTQSVC